MISRELGGARGADSSRRGCAAVRRARQLQRRPPGARRETLSRLAQRNHADRHRPRGKPGRRALASARQPGVREEMNMLSRRSFVAAGGAAARSPRLGFPEHGVRAEPPPTGVSCLSSSGARLTDCTSSHPPATRLCRLSRRLRPGPRQRGEARLLLHAPPGARRNGEDVCRQSRLCSSMPSPRPIATARTSTGRTCSRPAASALTG